MTVNEIIDHHYGAENPARFYVRASGLIVWEDKRYPKPTPEDIEAWRPGAMAAKEAKRLEREAKEALRKTPTQQKEDLQNASNLEELKAALIALLFPDDEVPPAWEE